VTLVRRWWPAVAGLVLLAIIAAGVVLAAGWVLLPVHTPGTKAVTLMVVSRTGPIAGSSVEVLAATSIEDVLAMTFAIQGSNQDICRTEKCWSSVKLDRPSLLIALSAPAPCHKSVLSADVGPGALLTIHEAVGALECPIGAQTLAVPSYWLLAVPLQDLPSKVVTVTADATDGAVGSTTADLRPPVPTQADHVTNVQELRSGLYTAQRDADLRPGDIRKRLTGLALRRWPRSDLGCSTSSSDADLAWGSLVVVGPFEYHELAGRTVLCGTTMMPTP
jgi:hypothetical protein